MRIKATFLSILFSILIYSGAISQCFPTQNFTTPGIHNYTLPGSVSDSYEIEITTKGADGGDFLWGGNPSSAGGSGATMTATYELQGGDVLFIVVGESGSDAIGSPGGGGGGGGTAVVVNSTEVLIAAAAGGGGGQNSVGQGAFANTNSPAQGGGAPGASGGGGFNNAGQSGVNSTGGGAGTLTSQGSGGTQGVVAGPGGDGFGGGGGGAGTVGGGGGGYKGGDGGAGSGNLNGKGGDSYVNSLYNSVVITNTPGVDGGGFNNNGSVVILCNNFTGSGSPTLVIESQSDPSCNGLSDGTITVLAMGGSGTGYMYSINGGTPTSNPVFTGLSAGMYTIVVTDSNGEMGMVSTTLTDPQVLSINILQTLGNICFAGMDGLIEVEGQGGSGSYLYQIDGGAPQSSGIFTNLASGFHDVTVTDINNCIVTENNIEILSPPQIEITISNQDNISCNGAADGYISFEADGGSGAFTFSLDGSNFEVTDNFSNLAPGDYQLTAMDGSACFESVDFTITEPDILTLSSSETNVLCNGGTDGIIELTANGGTMPYEYALDNNPFQSSSTFNMLGAGSYTIVVLDTNLCADTIIANIIEPGPIVLVVDTLINGSCGNADGGVTVSASSGTGPYTYTLDTLMNMTGMFNDLMAGSYTMLVEDVNNCTSSISFDISQGSTLTLVAEQTDSISCNGATDGSIQAIATGGSGLIMYSINGKPMQSSGIFDSLGSGLYTVTATDSLGCSISTDITLSEPSAISSNLFISSGLLCFGDSTGQVGMTMSGGTGDLTASYGGQSFTAPAGDTITFTGLSAMMIVVDITDENGCTSSDSISLSQPSALSPSVDTTTAADCELGINGSATISATGGTQPYSYILGDTVLTGIFTDLIAGDYVAIVEDANGCQATVDVSIAQIGGLIVDSITLNHLNCFGDTTGSAELIVSGGSGDYKFTLGDSTYTTGRFNNLSANDYLILIEDSQGCQSQYMFSINQPDLISVTFDSLSLNHVACFGDSTGSIQIIASGGSGDYTFTLDSTTNIDGAFGNLPMGNYTVIVEDTNTCQSQYMFTITEPDQLTLAIDSTGSGYVRVIGSGGTMDYSYSIDGGITFQMSGVFSDLSAGDYTIIVQDGNGCQSSMDVNIIVSNTTDLDPAIKAISVYPNPSENEIFIDLKLLETRSYSYHFYTLSGILVTSQNSGTFTKGHHVLRVDLNRFEAGSYILQFVTDKGVFNRKIIKVN